MAGEAGKNMQAASSKSDEPPAALDVAMVSHVYGKKQALDAVSFSIAPGRFTVLLGLNGAGKTTLFSLITRLYDTRRGTIRIFGRDILRDPTAALRQLGIVFQARTLDLDLSVAQNLCYHASLHGIGRRDAMERIAALLQQIGMSDRLHDKARNLSGGQMRRIEIVRALLHRPSLLLLDEATVGLDIRSRADILATIRKLVATENIGILWATHLIDEVAESDDVVILDKGKVLAAGSASSVIRATGASDIRQAFAALSGLDSVPDAAPDMPCRKPAPDDRADTSDERSADVDGCNRIIAGVSRQEPVLPVKPLPGFRAGQYLSCLYGITLREGLRFLNQRERFISSLVRPLLWLFVFAAGFRQVLGVSIIPPYKTYVLYETYITPGLCGMILLFSGMQSSLSMVYDREMGNMRILLVSPFPRSFLLISKLLAGVSVSIVQVYVFLGIAWFWGVKPPVGGYFWVLPVLFLAGLMLCSLGMLLSSMIRQLENFAGVMNFVIFPMYFASSALYPLWRIQETSPLLYRICQVNPFTYAVEFIRFALYGRIDWLSLAVVCGFTAVFLGGAVLAYDPAKGRLARRADTGGNG